MTGTQLDFSLSEVPTGWLDDQPEEQQSTGRRPNRRRKHSKAMPGVRRADLFTGSIVATLVCTMFGILWTTMQISQADPLALYAIPIGMAIAVAIRIGGGPGEPDTRAMASAAFYVVLVLVSTYMTARHYYVSMYHRGPSTADLDSWLLRNRLQAPRVVVPWLLGFWASIQTSYVLGRAHRSRRF